MEESVQGLSRGELLKRGAVGAAAIAGADALVRAGGAGAALTAPKPGGKLVVGTSSPPSATAGVSSWPTRCTTRS